MKKMRKLSIFPVLIVVFFLSGCQIVGILGTTRSSEEKIPAEYNLTEHTGQKILVLVNQPTYLNAEVNLRFYLTETINKYLTKKIGILPEYLVGYNELSEFRSNKSDFSLLPPIQVGEALDANMVLLVVVEDYQLNEIAETGYYKGNLNTQAVLLDTAAGEKLWPKSAKSKSIKVGFEIEDSGREVATTRLAEASAYCLVRYFYDCPKDKFKIADDRSGVGWQNWNK